MRRSRAILLVAALVVAVGTLPAACAQSAGGGEAPGQAAARRPPPAAPLPTGNDVYRPPGGVVDGPAGSLIWYEGIPSPVPGSQAWRILYRSRGADGASIAASGLLIRPTRRAPAGGFPVLSWAIGTPGIADICAPSKFPPVVPRLGRAIRAGFVVVATDGEGLGTRGPSRYLVGRSEAHTILDAARAARGLPGLVTSDKTAVWGYSSGGHGALFAAQAAAEYAPDLDLVGTAAVSPVVDVTRFIAPVDDHPGFTFITVGAWAKVYDLDPTTIFTPRAMERYPRLNHECALTLAFDWPLWHRQDLLRSDLTTTAPWSELMAEELAGTAALEGPVLLVHGSADLIVTPEPTEALARRLCRFGDTVDYRPIAGQDHFIAFTTGAQVIDWLAERAADQPATSTCS